VEWQFGRGLSYTDFVYSALTLSTQTLSEEEDEDDNDVLTVSVNVRNNGLYAAYHTVMMFVVDVYRRVTPESKSLKRYSKVCI
jgi:beta-glucosidase